MTRRYHSHVDMQVQTAQGPIIVYPKDNSSCPVKYDEDIVMMMGDYYHVRALMTRLCSALMQSVRRMTRPSLLVS